MLQKSQELVRPYTTISRLGSPFTSEYQGLTLDGQVFACKKCKKCFRKDAAEFEERYAYPTSDKEGVCPRLILPTLYAVTNTAHTAIITSFSRPSLRSRVCRWREMMRAWTTGISKILPDSTSDQLLTIPECSRMTAFAVTRKSPFSNSKTSPIAWAKERVLVWCHFHDIDDLMRSCFATISAWVFL